MSKAFEHRRQEILKKYEPFHAIYGRWLDEAEKATRAAGLSNYVERNKMPVYQRAQGLKCGLGMVEWHPTYEKVSTYLQEQVQEPNITEYFREGVQRILDDLLAENVTPIHLNNLIGD